MHWKKCLRLYKAKTRVGCDGFHPKVPERRNCEVSGEGGAEWKMTATSLYDHVLLDTEKCCKCETVRAHANVDSLVGSLESTRSGEVARL